MYIVVTNQNREEWLESRKNTIGATDAGTVMGMNPYCSIAELWAMKMGLLTDTFTMTESAHWGLTMEPVLAEQYATAVLDKYGNLDIAKSIENTERIKLIDTGNDLYVSKENPQFSCTPDRLCEQHPIHVGRGCIELKTIGEQEAQRWVHRIPPRYVVQVQWQMFVTESKWADLAILEGGNRFRVIHIERDNAMIKDIKTAVSNFIKKWQDGVEPGVEPTKAYEKYLEKRFDEQEGLLDYEKIVAEGLQDEYDDSLIFAKEYAKTMREEKVYKLKKLATSVEIKRRLGHRQGFTYSDGTKITWKTNNAGKRMFKVTVKN